MNLVSIIVPIFNTKINYIERCIKSIIHQEYKCFELILVDDGSETSCAEAIDYIAELDRRINVYHCLKGGVSKARNFGISHAKGEYIGFIDADDEVSENYIARAVKYIEKYNLDIVMGGILYVYGTHEQENKIQLFDKSFKVFEGEEKEKLLIQVIIDKQIDKLNSEIENCWMAGPHEKLYRRDLISEIFFSENIFMYEDRVFNIEAFKKARRIGISSDVWYVYYQYSSSAIHRNYPNMMDNHRLIINKISDILKNCNEDIFLAKSILFYRLLLESMRNSFNYISTRKDLIRYRVNLKHWIEEEHKNIKISSGFTVKEKFIYYLIKNKYYGLLWGFALISYFHKRKICESYELITSE